MSPAAFLFAITAGPVTLIVSVIYAAIWVSKRNYKKEQRRAQRRRNFYRRMTRKEA